ncbi:hypothetical protein HZC20_03440, partial [Candidatus Peregrinibacteria bacterium]|nr:hypothetical protein [Candidatus Peregrinibacteria bacterium]
WAVVLVLILAIAAIVGVYYFKFYKTQKPIAPPPTLEPASSAASFQGLLITDKKKDYGMLKTTNKTKKTDDEDTTSAKAALEKLSGKKIPSVKLKWTDKNQGMYYLQAQYDMTLKDAINLISKTENAVYFAAVWNSKNQVYYSSPQKYFKPKSYLESKPVDELKLYDIKKGDMVVLLTSAADFEAYGFSSSGDAKASEDPKICDNGKNGWNLVNANTDDLAVLAKGCEDKVVSVWGQKTTDPTQFELLYPGDKNQIALKDVKLKTYLLWVNFDSTQTSQTDTRDSGTRNSDTKRDQDTGTRGSDDDKTRGPQDNGTLTVTQDENKAPAAAKVKANSTNNLYNVITFTAKGKDVAIDKIMIFRGGNIGNTSDFKRVYIKIDEKLTATETKWTGTNSITLSFPGGYTINKGASVDFYIYADMADKAVIGDKNSLDIQNVTLKDPHDNLDADYDKLVGELMEIVNT